MTLSASDFEHVSGELTVEGVASLGDLCRSGAAIASANGQLWLAWCEDHTFDLNIMSSSDGYGFAQRQRLSYKSNFFKPGDSGGTWGTCPALTSHNDVLVLAWPYGASILKRSERYPALMWANEQNVVMAGQSKAHLAPAGVAVTSWRDQVVLAWAQSVKAGGVVVAHARDGVFSDPIKVVKAGALRPIADAPDICAVNDDLLVSWVDQKAMIRYRLNVVPVQGGQPGPRMEFPGVMVARMCELGGEPVVAWHELKQLCVGFLRGGELRPALRLRAGSRFNERGTRPAVCVHNGKLVLAWTDPGRQLHIAHIRRT